MAHNADYVPSRDADFDGWLENLVNYVNNKTGGTKPVWAMIPPEKSSRLNDLREVWHEKYGVALGPHTPVDTEAKQEARRELESFVRAFVQQYLKFDPVTDEDRTAMRLHNRDSIKTAIGVPATRPVIGEPRAIGGFRVEIPFFDEGSPGSKKIPYGDNGCLLYYAVGPERVTDYNGLVKTKLMTHSPFMVQLEPEAEGKFFSCACRWQNETGQVGPWSEVHHIAVN